MDVNSFANMHRCADNLAEALNLSYRERDFLRFICSDIREEKYTFEDVFFNNLDSIEMNKYV